MRMTHDHRPPRADQIDVAAAVRIPHVRAAGPRDERRRPSDRAESPHRGVHPARNGALSALEELFVPIHQDPGRRETLDSAGKGPSFGRTSYHDVVGMLANSPEDLES